MSDEALEKRADELRGAIDALKDKLSPGVSAEDFKAVKGQLEDLTNEFADVQEERQAQRQAEEIEEMKANIERLNEAARPSSKAAAIFGGVLQNPESAKAAAEGNWLQDMFLSSMYHDREAADRVAQYKATKAVLGTSGATGTYIIPNNFVADVQQIAAPLNIFRQLMNVVEGVSGAGVDIPYEITAIEDAVLQGGLAVSYGSNKQVKDFQLGRVTATLYPIAQIVDIGNQLLQQSAGAAERLARTRLGRSFARGELQFILNGSGTNQPNGIYTSIQNTGTGAYSTALTSESRASAIGRGIGALAARDYSASAIIVHPTNFWSLATETLGTSGSGGWALAPAAGASSLGLQAPMSGSLHLWGVPVYTSSKATLGTALVSDFSQMDLYFGMDYTISVSSEAANRWDQNITGFRAEEMMGFNADPYVLTGMVQRITGIT